MLVSMKRWGCIATVLTLALWVPAERATAAVTIEGKDFASLQEAIDAHPGQLIHLPAGDYAIDTALAITHDGSGLSGGGRIIQSNPDQDVISITGVKDVRILDVTLTRAEGQQDATRAAIRAENCERLTISGVQVLENRSPMGSISLTTCSQSRVEGCLVRNYKRIFIDDRTKSPLSGYAFKAIDGTGIQVRDSKSIQLSGNRIIESRYIPTKANRDKYELGTLTVKPEKPGRLMPQEVFDSGYTNNWHQGAGIQVGGPEVSDFIQITGNYFENPAQGMDIHADHVVIANNEINHAMIGMKTMHGAKHVLIEGNQFTYCDLWGLKLMPGASSHAAVAATDGKAARPENVDGGTIVANNIFTHFGMGDQYWNWENHKNDYPERSVIVVLFGQLEENPSIRDIMITGNMVYDSGREPMLIDGKPQSVGPRYFYGLYVEEQRAPAPKRVVVRGNMIDPGMTAASNLKLDE